MPNLLVALNNLHEERREEAEELSREIEQVEQVYKGQLRDEQTRLTALLENPPWGEHDLPTGFETAEKIKAFVARLARLLGKDVSSEIGLPDLLGLTPQWIESASSLKRMDREKQRDALRKKVGRADELLQLNRQTEAEFETGRSRMQQLTEKLQAALMGKTRESLRSDFEKLDRAKTEHDARQAVTRRAKEVCENHPTGVCPACGTSFEPSELLRCIKAQCDVCQATGMEGESLDEMGWRVAILDEVDAEERTLGPQIESKRNTIKEAFRAWAELLGVDGSISRVDAIEVPVAELRADMESLNRQLEDADAERQQELRRVRELQQEQKYHECRDRESHIEWKLVEGMKDARDLLRDYRNLLARTAEVRTLIERSFKEALDKAIPTLEQMFTEVYKRHLVPYFVFSRFQPEIMELDLLLIDDPSESFDTSHVGLLIQEFAGAARHAQLIVASHEQEKFEPLLKINFVEEPYVILRVDRFDPLKGPQPVWQ